MFVVVRRLKPSAPKFITSFEPTALVVGALSNIRKLFDIIKKSSETDLQKAELNRINMLLEEKEKLIDSLSGRNYFGKQVLDEITSLYPQVIKCSYADSYEFNEGKPEPEKVEIIILTTKDKKLGSAEKQKIEGWLRARLKSDRIKVYYE